MWKEIIVTFVKAFVWKDESEQWKSICSRLLSWFAEQGKALINPTEPEILQIDTKHKDLRTFCVLYVRATTIALAGQISATATRNMRRLEFYEFVQFNFITQASYSAHINP